MTVTVASEVGGRTVSLQINGVRLVMDVLTADQVANQILHHIDQIHADQVAKHQQDALYRQINGSH